MLYKQTNKNTQGFTLIEVLIAIFILAIGIFGVMALIPVGIRQTDTIAKKTIVATSSEIPFAYTSYKYPAGNTNGNNCPLLPASRCKPSILGRKICVFGMAGSPGRLIQDSAKPIGCLLALCRFSFCRLFMRFPHPFYRLRGAFFNAYHASLAVVIIGDGIAVFVNGNAAVGTPGNANHTFRADIIIPDRLKHPPVTRLS